MRTQTNGFLPLLLLSFTGPAIAAQPGFALDRFQPSEAGSWWLLADSLSFGNHALRAGAPARPLETLALKFGANVAGDPLVVATGSNVHATVVSLQSTATLGASLTVVDRLRVGLAVPMQLFASGAQGVDTAYVYAPPASAFALGDLRVGAHYRVLGDESLGSTRLALGGVVHAPTGDAASYAGSESWRVEPQALGAGEFGDVAWAASAGLPLSSAGRKFGSLDLGTELVTTAAIGVRLIDRRLLVGPEARVVTSLQGELFARRTSTYEPMVGAHYAVAEGWRVHLSAGTGLGEGVGSPTWRAAFAVQWAPIGAEPPPVVEVAAPPPVVAEPPPPAPVVEEPTPLPPPVVEAPPEPLDTDGDGILDNDDACPTEPGPAHADAKKNGCPVGAIVAGELVLDNVRFATDSDRILAVSDETLTKVLTTIQKLAPDQRFVIEGHTDDRGDAKHNKSLSARRAKSVVQWFAKKGVDAKRFDSAGYGEEKPIATNETVDGRQANRRVEIHLVK